MATLIPANIITGFLGVGKTTAILHLLKHKPAHETWSVLVNEFGEIGIDGALLQGGEGIHVREVPGGCICCAAGLPMKVALNMLIARTRPHRILIEPTGLGHPEEIIRTLTGDSYQEVLDLRATLTLVDPRRLADPRYTGNASFNDQLALADVVIANKTDLASAEDRQRFDQWMQAQGADKQGREWVEQGRINPAWLSAARQSRTAAGKAQHLASLAPRRTTGLPLLLPEGEPWLSRCNASSGFYSAGWLFHPAIQFDFNGFFLLASGLAAMRFKAVLNTGQGRFVFNAEQGVLSVNQPALLDDGEPLESRVECIDDQPIDSEALQAAIFALQLPGSPPLSGDARSPGE